MMSVLASRCALAFLVAVGSKDSYNEGFWTQGPYYARFLGDFEPQGRAPVAEILGVLGYIVLWLVAYDLSQWSPRVSFLRHVLH